MTNQKLRVGTRGSALALAQVEEIKSLLAQKGVAVSLETVTFDTTGDKDKKTSLTDAQVPDDFFTDALDQALLNGKIDVAIHSAKDLPKNLNPDLKILALTASLDDTDAFVGRVHFKDLPPGAKVATSSALRQQALKKLNPALATVDIRGNIQERIRQLEEGFCDGLIVATAALKRLGLGHLIKDVMPWEATPLQGQLAVVGRVAAGSSLGSQLEDFFRSIDVRKNYGKVVLVGAGPGDPELITVKGVRALQQADCVFYDYLVDPKLLQHAVKAEKIYVGKRKGAQTLPQPELSKRLRLKATAGKNVVRLKGGDPLIFGRGADEIDYLRAHHVLVEIIPGVSSATAIPSRLGIPLTARNVSSSVAFLSGHGKEEESESPQPIAIPAVDTLVFLMGLTKLAVIVKSLADNGWKDSTPIIVISKGTRADERIVDGTLKDIQTKVAQENLEPPALIVVGEVVRFFRKQDSRKQKFLYTGTNPQKYSALGEIIHFPMIQIEPVPLVVANIERIKNTLHQYQFIVFTSRFGVKCFFEFLQARKYSLENLQAKDFFVIGQATATALREFGFEPAVVAEVESSEGLLEAIQEKHDVKNKAILFPRSNLPNPFLEDELKKLGAQVDVLAIYENTKPEFRALPQNGIRNVIFTSPSTVNNFLKDYGKIPAKWRILSRGPLTTKTLQEAGYKPEVLINE